MPTNTAKRNKSAKRKRSTFKPTTSSHLRARRTVVVDNKGDYVVVSRQGGGFGHLNNNCRCRNCNPMGYSRAGGR